VTQELKKCFHIINLGCKVNRVDADSMAARLLASGARHGSLAEANVVLINTCTVTGEADAKSRKALRRSLRTARDATVIVCGCGATTDPEQFEGISGKHKVIAGKQAALLEALKLLELEAAQEDGTDLRAGEGFNTRAQVKVQDGCNHACSYCVVPQARGPACSEPLEHVLKELAILVKAGAQEIVLTGIDLGSYQDDHRALEHLLKEALKLGSFHRLRLSSIELPSISDGLIDLMVASEGRICAHLHIPLQSGSNKVLAAMKRRYDARHFELRTAEIKHALPHIAMSTDVMVGFPGETTQDFEQTIKLCQKIGFARMHVFRYSRRPRTTAADLPHQVDARHMALRAKTLSKVANELRLSDAQARIGSTELVLFENSQIGRSESYYPVRVKENMQRGSLSLVKLVGYVHDEFTGQTC